MIHYLQKFGILYFIGFCILFWLWARWSADEYHREWVEQARILGYLDHIDVSLVDWEELWELYGLEEYTPRQALDELYEEWRANC